MKFYLQKQKIQFCWSIFIHLMVLDTRECHGMFGKTIHEWHVLPRKCEKFIKSLSCSNSRWLFWRRERVCTVGEIATAYGSAGLLVRVVQLPKRFATAFIISSSRMRILFSGRLISGSPAPARGYRSSKRLSPILPVWQRAPYIVFYIETLQSCITHQRATWSRRESSGMNDSLSQKVQPNTAAASLKNIKSFLLDCKQRCDIFISLNRCRSCESSREGIYWKNSL